MIKSCLVTAVLVLIFFVSVEKAFAQTTEFVYQGQLQSASVPANGNFDFEFLLFSAAGSQVGPTLTRNNVAVANGIFSVNLDFGGSFSGAALVLEIHVRTAGGGAFTTLSPRQPVTSSPYSIKSLSADTASNAANAVTAINFTGNLAGDVNGTQGATSVERLQGRSVANTAPIDGQVLKFNTANNRWQPDTDNAGSSGGGTITGVAAGTGLTGGGTTGNVSLSIAIGGVGTNQIADNSVTDAKINGVSGSKVAGAVSNSTQLGGVAANQYVVTGDARLSDARPPTPGSPNYVQNGIAQQATSNFNISGTGKADVLDAGTQFNIGGNRILGIPGTDNLFLGRNAGAANTTGQGNSFFGWNAGTLSNANFNSFFGTRAGDKNVTGCCNSFFGYEAGTNTNGISGSQNAFFGSAAGRANTSGFGNTFIGEESGLQSTTGLSNAFLGYGTGSQNSTGNRNAFVGAQSGFSNSTGSSNSTFGYKADLSGNNLSNATAIGANSQVGQSNSLVLGSINLVNGATADTNVGIGTTTPAHRLHVVGNGLFTGDLTVNGTLNAGLPSGSSNYIQNTTSPQAASNFNISGNGTMGGTLSAASVGIGTTAGGFKLNVQDASSSSITRLMNSGNGSAILGQSSAGAGIVGTGQTYGVEGITNGTTFGSSYGVYGHSDALSGSAVGVWGNALSPNGYGVVGQASASTLGGNGVYGISSGPNGIGVRGFASSSTGVNYGIYGVSNSPDGFGVSGFANTGAGVFGGSSTGYAGYFQGKSYFTGNVSIGTTVTNGTLTVASSSNAIFASNSSSSPSIFGLSGTGDGVAGSSTSGTGVSGGSTSGYGVFGTSSSSRGVSGGSTTGTAGYFDSVSGTGVYAHSTSGYAINARSENTHALYADGSIFVNRWIVVQELPGSGMDHVCRSASNILSMCSSSLRYKQNIDQFPLGLSLISRLRPIKFDWKADGKHDLGLAAEDVEKIEPLLVTYNKNGQVEGVKYDRIGVVLINAVKEQQAQIEAQQKQIERQEAVNRTQRDEIAALKSLVCARNRRAAICQTKK